MAGLTYKLIQIAVLLVTIGTILGGLWADVSWGRFWGWDPKEVWALITLLVYMLILHGRPIGWSGNFAMALISVVGFAALVFAWYGVNFLLPGGKHSYGEGAGGQWQVVTALVVNLAFAAAAGVRYFLQPEASSGGAARR